MVLPSNGITIVTTSQKNVDSDSNKAISFFLIEFSKKFIINFLKCTQIIHKNYDQLLCVFNNYNNNSQLHVHTCTYIVHVHTYTHTCILYMYRL